MRITDCNLFKAALAVRVLRFMRQPWILSILFCLWLVMAMPAAFGDERIKGGCIVGESAIAHGRSDAEAVTDMRRYAQLYVNSFQKYRKTERSIREGINELLELEQWTQADIVAFTKNQRELLYLSVGMQLATGRTTADELPEYARTIRQRITEIEIELNCDILSGSQ